MREEIDKALELVDQKEFTYVQCFWRKTVPVSKRHPHGWKSVVAKFVVLVSTKAKAAPLAAKFALEKWGELPLEMHFYPRTYIREARVLVRSELFIQSAD